jgi:uncharacterized membrane protein
MPLAFALLLVVAELMRLKSAWQYAGAVMRVAALVACLGSTTAAFLSGYQASNGLPDLAPPVAAALGAHHAWGRVLLVTIVLLCAFAWVARIATHGKRIFDALYYLTLGLYVALVIYVGSLGGALVFKQGLGVTYQPLTAPSSGS